MLGGAGPCTMHGALRFSPNNGEYNTISGGILMAGIWKLDSRFAYGATDAVSKARRIS